MYLESCQKHLNLCFAGYRTHIFNYHSKIGFPFFSCDCSTLCAPFLPVLDEKMLLLRLNCSLVG